MNDFICKVEFAIQLKNEFCEKKVVQELSLLNGVQIENISASEQRLVLKLEENAPSAFEIQKLIERKLGFNTIIRGTGDFITAVSEIQGSSTYPHVTGVARFVQNESKQCLVDAVIEGLETNQQFRISFHEYGDLSDRESFKSIGKEIFLIEDELKTQKNELIFKKKVENCDLTLFFARTLAIKNKNEVVAAAIIARASKILDNAKKICACSGKTLWQERETFRSA